MRVPWLADVLRNAGLKVVEVQGWRGRGPQLRAVHGLIIHHTATSPSLGPIPTANLLVKGTRKLRGPLAQLGLDRQGAYWVISDGDCNHDGYGRWGNDSIGIEAANTGTGEPWPAVQMDAYVRGSAAVLRALGFGTDRLLGHRESASHKIDPVGIDLNAFRASVGQLLGNEEDDLTPEQAAQLKDVHASLQQLRALDDYVRNTLQPDLASRIAKRPTEDEVRKIVLEALQK